MNLYANNPDPASCGFPPAGNIAYLLLDLSNAVTSDTSAAGNITISEAKTTQTIACDGKDLTVSGAQNVVTIEAAARINVCGSKNKVTWPKRASPKVSTPGSGNEVRAAP